MKEFNLYSGEFKSKKSKGTKISIPKNLRLSIYILGFVIFLSALSFGGKLYVDNQLSDKGRRIIDLQTQQLHYTSIVDGVNEYNARKNTSKSISTNRLNYEYLINQIDNFTANSVNAYSINKDNLIISLKGSTNAITDSLQYVSSMRSSNVYTNLKLSSIVRSANAYEYSISFNAMKK